ncbi:MAG: RNA polymerase sigma factor RpoD/SigA [Parcubacteria group bacterium]|nr:RNA polymerase sigma factor RpoD/SigA [Parcubacteria group bacterium]
MSTGMLDEVSDAVETYFTDIEDSMPLSRSEETELAKRIKAGDIEARNALVQANLRFVVSVAKEHQNRGLPLSDLISAGNLGLITAAERFDHTRGYKFISYAVWWIRQAILQAIAEQSRTVLTPRNKFQLFAKMAKVSPGLSQDHGRSPEVHELAEALGEACEEVEAAIMVGYPIASLDDRSRRRFKGKASDQGDEGKPGLDRIPDESCEPPDEALGREELRAQVDTALAKLVRSEAEVLRLYFGLDGEEPMTLEQIGALFGRTRERIRQIKEKALSHLRKPTLVKQGIRAAAGGK